jgi:hypothetical protein
MGKRASRYAPRPLFLLPLIISSSERENSRAHPVHLTPEDLENEELAAYAEEYTALADFTDLDAMADELFNWSDEETPEYGRRLKSKGKGKAHLTDDVNMSG